MQGLRSTECMRTAAVGAGGRILDAVLATGPTAICLGVSRACVRRARSPLVGKLTHCVRLRHPKASMCQRGPPFQVEVVCADETFPAQLYDGREHVHKDVYEMADTQNVSGTSDGGADDELPYDGQC